MTQHLAKGRAAKEARQKSAKERAEKRAAMLAAAEEYVQVDDMQST